MLTLLTAGSLGLGGLFPQVASAPQGLISESSEIRSDTVATTYIQGSKRSGSGRRGMRGMGG
ncbi:MAG: hypothetical protein WBA99_19280 [Nodosilinea sp.]